MERWSVMWPLTIGAIACSLTALVGAYLAALGSAANLVAFFLPYLAAAVLALGAALRRPGLVTTAGALVLCNFLMAGRTIELVGASSFATPITAAGLFAITQLGWWAIDLTIPAYESPVALLLRAGELLLGSMGTGALALLVLQFGRLPAGSGLQFVFIGAGLSLLFLVAVTAHARRARHRMGPLPEDSGVFLGDGPREGLPPTARRHTRLRAIIRTLRGPAYPPGRPVSRLSVILLGWAMLGLLALDVAFAPTMAPVTDRVFRVSEFVYSATYTTHFAVAYAAATIIGALALGIWLRRLVLYQTQRDARTFVVPGASASTRQDLLEWRQIHDACNRSQASRPPDPDLAQMLTAIASNLPQLRGAPALVAEARTKDTGAPRSPVDTGLSSVGGLLHSGDLRSILAWLEASSDV
ncbi:MAG TPA: hypothetical protein VMW80_09635 [Candidatus Dormibacteraeota bacterium]|nr:hypothetical protein [Candidatus Dormibacteraeota bacterium]